MIYFFSGWVIFHSLFLFPLRMTIRAQPETMEHLLLCAMLHHMFNSTESPEAKGTLPNISGACGGLEEVAKPGRNLYRAFYTFVTPVIVVVGLFGNSLCIVLLLSRELRRHRSSIFFITLAIVDICSLLFYVTVEWMDRSLALQLGASWVHWRDRPGICQLLLYLTYVLRLMAAWILVVTAAERYFGEFVTLFEVWRKKNA